MQGLCVFSVVHFVEGAFGAAFGGTPKWKMGPREMNSKMAVVVVGPALNQYILLLLFFEPQKNKACHSGKVPQTPIIQKMRTGKEGFGGLQGFGFNPPPQFLFALVFSQNSPYLDKGTQGNGCLD